MSRPHFSLAAFWDIHLCARGKATLSYFRLSVSRSLLDPFRLLGKLGWFSHPIQYYLHVPRVSIYHWSSNVVNLFVLDRKASNLKQFPLCILLYEGRILFKHLLQNLMWQFRAIIIINLPIQTMLFFLAFVLWYQQWAWVACVRSCEIRHNRPFALVDQLSLNTKHFAFEKFC